MRTTLVALFALLYGVFGYVSSYAALNVTNGLTLWLDASAVSGATNYQALSSWENISGSSYVTTQAVAGAQPTYVTNALGGMPALSFDGNDLLSIAALQNDWPSSNGTIYIVSRADHLAHSSYIFRSEPLSAVRLSSHLPWSDGDNYFDFGDSTGGSGRLQWSNAGTDDLHVWCFRSQSGVGKQAYRDGILQVSAASTAVFPATNFAFVVGDQYQGDIGEMLIYNRALSSGEQDQVGVYLAGKYGVTNAYTTDSRPRSIAGLELWLDASSLQGHAQGDPVTNWFDLSGNAKHASQSDTNAQPVYATNAIDDKPAVRFDGTTDFLDGPAATITAKTIFLVLKVDPASVSLSGVFAQKGADWWNIRTLGGQWNSHQNGNINSADFNYQGDISINGASGFIHNHEAHILVEIDADTSSFQYRLSQTLHGRYFKGDLAEVIIYNRELTFSEAGLVGTYLDQKYGLNTSYDAISNTPEASDVSASSATLHGTLRGTNSISETVSVYWGTHDGATNAAAWQNGVTFPTSTLQTVYSTNITGLSSGTLHYYRFFVSNAVSTAWAETSAHFKTLFTENTNGLALWLDASAIAGLANGEPVGHWEDLSGNARDLTQAEVVRQPVYRSGGMNGRPSLEFDGADDRMFRGGVNLKASEIFVVTVVDNTLGWNNLLSSANDQNNIRAHNNGYRENNPNDFSTGGTFRQNNLHDLTLVTGKVHIVHTAIPTFRTFGTFMVGDNGTHDRYWDGDIAEVIVYDRVLSTRERTDIGLYLADKYGINAPYSDATLPEGTQDAALWFAADAITGTADGESVSTWYDMSGNSRNGNAANANSGILYTNAVGGLPAVRFDGANGRYFTFPVMADIRAVFWVLKEDADATAPRFLLGDSSSDTTFHFHRGGSKYLWGPNTHVNVLNGVTAINGTPVDGTSTPCPTNHALISVRTTGNVRANNFVRDRISIDPQRNWDGDLAELIIYTRELSESEHSRVGHYLNEKYGLNADFPLVDTDRAGGITTNAASFQGGLAHTSGGLDTTVRVYWGTSDGGTNAAGWEHTNSFAAVSNAVGLATNITGLAADTVYFYRYFATNSAGTAWADAGVLFKTLFNAVSHTPQLWLDASALPHSNGVAVAEWMDVSGRMRHLSQSDTNRQPVFADTGFNGRPSVAFDGLADRMQRNGVNLPAREIFAVAVSDTQAGWENLLSNTSDGHNIRASDGAYSTGLANDFPGAGKLRQNNRITLTQTAGEHVVIHAEADFLKTFGTFMLADNGTHNRYWFGDIAEVIVYDQPLNRGERDSVGLYLAAKYGVSTHYRMVSNEEGASNINRRSAVLNGAVGVTSAEVTVLWGHTDGGTNWRAWAYTNALGTTDLGEFASSVTGLTERTAYYYRCYATNATGSAWASSTERFITSKTPPVEGGLTLWFDAGVTWVTDHGDTVALWPDLSGNDNHGINNGGAPRLVLNAQKGRPAVSFDGTDSTYLSWGQMNDIRTVFWVVREDPNATNVRFLLGTTGGANIHHFHRGAGASKTIWGGSSLAAVRSGVTKLDGRVVDGLTTVVPTNAFGIISVRTTGNATADSFSFDRTINGRTWHGELAELMIFNRALTDEEERSVGTYLSVKYRMKNDYLTNEGMLLMLR